jgi:phenylpyruvate tautomerase PptA (4-oxalocrotonate tautomerase family)
MPTAKIYVHEGRYDEQRLAKLGHAVQGALESVLKIPPEDYYRIVHVLPSHHFAYSLFPRADLQR